MQTTFAQTRALSSKLTLRPQERCMSVRLGGARIWVVPEALRCLPLFLHLYPTGPTAAVEWDSGASQILQCSQTSCAAALIPQPYTPNPAAGPHAVHFRYPGLEDQSHVGLLA